MRILPFSLLLFVHLVPPSLAADVASRDSIREIQTILSLKGVYDGRIDGLIGPITERSILRYEQQLGWPLTGSPSDRLLERLSAETEAALKGVVRGNDDHDKPKAQAESDVNNINKKLEALARDLNHTESHLVKLSSSLNGTQRAIDDHFIRNFTEATVLAVASFGILAGLIGLGIKPLATWITKKVDESHKSMVELSADRIAARIYGTFGGSSIELYQHINRDKPHTKALYDSYLGIAVSLSSIGYMHAKSLFESVGRNKERLSPLDKLDKHVYEACVNNKLFYLATRATDEDKREAESILREAERIAAEYEASKEPHWWTVKETIAWSNLNFDYEPRPP